MTPDRQRNRLRLVGTALGRPLDLRHRSNVIAVAGGAVAGILTALLTTLAGEGFSAPTAARVGVGVFLGWALARELSPDSVHAATLALLVAGVLASIEIPALGINVVALVAIRAWAGTVGHHPTIVDFLGAVGLAAFAGTDPAMWTAGAALAVGIVTHSPHKLAASATVAAMITAGIVAGIIAGPSVAIDVSPAEVATLAAIVLLAAFVLPIRTVDSLTDRSPRPMSPTRVTAGWIVALTAVAGVALLGRAGEAGPILAAVVAAAAIGIAKRLKQPTPSG